MNKIINWCIIGLIAALTTSCVATTQIQSIPTGAGVYIEGEYRGDTPYNHQDKKTVGMSTNLV